MQRLQPWAASRQHADGGYARMDTYANAVWCAQHEPAVPGTGLRRSAADDDATGTDAIPNGTGRHEYEDDDGPVHAGIHSVRRTTEAESAAVSAVSTAAAEPTAADQAEQHQSRDSLRMGTGEGAEERAHTGHLASEGEPNRRINSVKGAEFS